MNYFVEKDISGIVKKETAHRETMNNVTIKADNGGKHAAKMHDAIVIIVRRDSSGFGQLRIRWG